MNVFVSTVDGVDSTFLNAAVTFDVTLLQVDHDGQTTSFPLVNVISFTTSESGPK